MQDCLPGTWVKIILKRKHSSARNEGNISRKNERHKKSKMTLLKGTVD